MVYRFVRDVHLCCDNHIKPRDGDIYGGFMPLDSFRRRFMFKLGHTSSHLLLAYGGTTKRYERNLCPLDF